MSPYEKRLCNACGREFIPRKPQQKSCTSTCRVAAYRASANGQAAAQRRSLEGKNERRKRRAIFNEIAPAHENARQARINRDKTLYLLGYGGPESSERPRKLRVSDVDVLIAPREIS